MELTCPVHHAPTEIIGTGTLQYDGWDETIECEHGCRWQAYFAQDETGHGYLAELHQLTED